MTKTGQRIPEVIGMLIEGKINENRKSSERAGNESSLLAGVVAIHHKALADRRILRSWIIFRQRTGSRPALTWLI